MKKIIFCLLIVIARFTNSYSQNPNIEWQKCFGGTNSEGVSDLIKTFDGNYLAVGVSNSNDIDVSGNHGGFDYWVVKFDSVGTLEWQKSYGGNVADYAFCIRQTADAGFIVTGLSSSYNGNGSSGLLSCPL